MNTELIIEFVHAINDKNLVAMSNCLSTDHCFTDSSRNSVNGIEATLKAWKSYFNKFPDYQLEVEKQIHHGNAIAIFTTVSGNTKKQSDTVSRNAIAWKIEMKNKKIKSLNVYTTF